MPNTPVLGLPYPVASDTADVPRDLGALALALDSGQQYVPVGGLILWPIAGVPAGALLNGKAAWLACNGQVVLAVDYPKLAGLLGQSGGNITIPDLKDRVALGASTARPVGQLGGEEKHTILASELPAHAHAPGSLAIGGGATTTGGENVDHLHFIAAEGRTVAAGVSTIYCLPGSGGVAYNHATGGRNTGHVHGVPAHAHTVSGATADSAAPSAQTPLIQPYLAMNYVMRAA